jgi:3-hydroxyisobutyrate dehydrogenase-like beta-hydroxyacid dehydrogenase
MAEQTVVVLPCGPSEDTARDALLADDGVVTGVKNAGGLVERSTASPETARQLADEVSARRALTIDASVSGSSPLSDRH